MGGGGGGRIAPKISELVNYFSGSPLSDGIYKRGTI